mgnify:FL=1
MSKILILVATMGGTAEMVAEEVADRIEDVGEAARILRMEKADSSVVAAAERVIVCSSSYGAGDVPDNGQAFLDALKTERPDLSTLRYGVIALGDTEYPQTFCGGGKTFDALFTDLGATRLGERLEIDARSGVFPEEVAGVWVEHWLEMETA